MIINLISFLRQLAYAELKVRVNYTKLLFNVPYDYSNVLRMYLGQRPERPPSS